ncbi:MAG: prepilin peptidase [Lachnospiraceae bacterium]|nr:prepilin peptidase [Lachnospiraceae bacterium]
MIRYIGMFLLLIPCTVTDVRTRLVPVWFAGIFSACALLYHLLFTTSMLKEVVFGALMGLLFIGISRISRGALGMGDAILILSLGIWCGLQDSFTVILFAFILSGLFGGIVLLVRKKKRQETLPFVPFLLLSAVISFAVEMAQGGLVSPG